MSKIPAVTECHMTTGSRDYIAWIYARSLGDYETVIKDELGKTDDIAKLESLLIVNDIVPGRGIKV